jgi:hypothetical protein
MIERKLVVGSYLDIGDIATLNPGGVPGEISQGAEDRTIEVSHRQGWFGSKQRDIVAGENATKSHRNFVWLPYAIGQINYATPQGKDVLSGVFTGCWMMRYSNGGVVRVAHVSTPTASAAWNALAANNQVQVLQGFKPTDFHDASAATEKGDYGLEMFGLVTDAGNLFTIGLQRRGSTGGLRRIAFVAPALSRPLAELAAVPTDGVNMG